jgi:hypothetical protein
MKMNLSNHFYLEKTKLLQQRRHKRQFQRSKGKNKWYLLQANLLIK